MVSIPALSGMVMRPLMAGYSMAYSMARVRYEGPYGNSFSRRRSARYATNLRSLLSKTISFERRWIIPRGEKTSALSPSTSGVNVLCPRDRGHSLKRFFLKKRRSNVLLFVQKTESPLGSSILSGQQRTSVVLTEKTNSDLADLGRIWVGFYTSLPHIHKGFF